MACSMSTCSASTILGLFEVFRPEIRIAIDPPLLLLGVKIKSVDPVISHTAEDLDDRGHVNFDLAPT